MTTQTSKNLQHFAPLIDRDEARMLGMQSQSLFAGILEEAQRIAGTNASRPQAAIARRTNHPPYFHGQHLKIEELTNPSHGLMLHAMLNALPIADVSENPNVINDTSTRDDFENVCPVRFLAIFPLGNNAGYLVLYDVKPMVLQPTAFAELCTLAQSVYESINKCE